MVRGLEYFKMHFAPHSEKYVLIGGVACFIAMADAGLDFRATKDLDIVLHIEALDREFVRAFWAFIRDGKYQNRQKSTGKEIFYRFYSPGHPEYPAMLELFSRLPDTIELEEGNHLTPISVNEAPASLSAILLDQDYYEFLHQGKCMRNGLPIVDAPYLIPLKAKAWLELKSRKNQIGDVDEKDLRKHKNDIFRLYQLLSSALHIEMPQSIEDDMSLFLEQIEKDACADLKNLGLNYKQADEVIDNLKKIYTPNRAVF